MNTYRGLWTARISELAQKFGFDVVEFHGVMSIIRHAPIFKAEPRFASHKLAGEYVKRLSGRYVLGHSHNYEVLTAKLAYEIDLRPPWQQAPQELILLSRRIDPTQVLGQ